MTVYNYRDSDFDVGAPVVQVDIDDKGKVSIARYDEECFAPIDWYAGDSMSDATKALLEQHGINVDMFMQNVYATAITNKDVEVTSKITEEELDDYKLVEGPEFTLNLEPDNFFAQFSAYGKEVSDAYEEYWFAGAVNIVSILLDKKIVIKARSGDYFTNFYVNILGASTLARKSTAVDKVEDVLRMVLMTSASLSNAVVPTPSSLQRRSWSIWTLTPTPGGPGTNPLAS
jgi:hypothetical protein